MKNKTVIISIVVVLLIVGAGVFYFLTKDKNNTDTTAKNDTSNTASSSQEAKQEEPKKVSLSDALATIGATGNDGPVNGNTYTLNSVEYKFDEPSSWDTSMKQRQQACEQGYVNTGYQIATDGSTWFATTNNNEDLTPLVNALKGAGIDAKVASYC